MKITCSQRTLNKALNTVFKAVPTRTTIPILRGILLETTSDHTVKLTATDSEISIEKEIDCPLTMLSNGPKRDEMIYRK